LLDPPQFVLALLLPLIISRMRTPKLYTSAFRVNWPPIAYSGAK